MGSGQEAWTLGAALAEGGRVGAGLELRPAFVPRIAVFLILAATLLVWSCVVGTVLKSVRSKHPLYSHNISPYIRLQSMSVCR